MHSCQPTGKFTLSLISITFNLDVHLRSYTNLLSLFSIKAAAAGKEPTFKSDDEHGDFWNFFQRMKDTGWVSSTSVGCGSTSE